MIVRHHLGDTVLRVLYTSNFAALKGIQFSISSLKYADLTYNSSKLLFDSFNQVDFFYFDTQIDRYKYAAVC